MTTPITPTVDWRDIRALRDDLARCQRQVNDLTNMMESLANRMLMVEASGAEMHTQLALYQQGVRERLNAIGVLLSELKDAVERKDVE